MLEKRTLNTRKTGRWLTLALAGIIALMAGTALAADTDIVITEVMQNPAVLADADGEWFEVYNGGATPVDLNGWTVSDLGTDSFVIGASAIVPAGGYAVIGNNAVAMAGEGVTLVYEFSGMFIGNSADEIILTNASAVEIDRIEYDGGATWPDPTGASMMWDEATADNNIGANWSTSTAPFGSGDLGTPGLPNGGAAPQPPVVADVYHRTLLPTPGEAVTIYATITDGDGTISSANLFYQVNGGGYSSLAMSNVGDEYTATIAGGLLGDAVDYYVSATDNDAQTTTNPSDAPVGFYTYNVANEFITPIATIHADSAGYDGTLVMVQAQVFIPGNYQADLTSVSAYVQDGSNRGLNIFGTTRSTGMSLLNDTSAIVKVSGYVDYYYSTLELVNYEVELVSTGSPELTPSTQTTAAAAAPSNEGTFIHSVGPITAIATSGGSNPAHNFTVDDGSGPLVIRIDDDLVVGMDTWLVGELLEASGAGGTYAAQGQIIVGEGSKVLKGADVAPPLLTGAELTAPTTVTLTFNEGLDPVTAGNTANYQVYETAIPGNTITVTGAAPAVNVVVLTLDASASGISHTVQVDNVEDVAGNPIAAATTMLIFEAGGPADIVITEVMQNPAVLSDTDGEWFEVYNTGVSAVDMNGWIIKDAGFDSTVIDNGGPLVINPGEYKVFVRNATAMAAQGVSVFYQYTSFTLGNSDDELILTDATDVVMDSIAWDGGPVWPDPTGYSMQWNGTGDNNDGTNWADRWAPAFGTGDRGTPGAANDVVSPVPGADLQTTLDANYPNPFNPLTRFSFSLDKTERVTLAIFDLRGHRVATVLDSVLPAGRYDQQYSWDGTDSRGARVTSGTYFYRLTTASGFSEAGKMMLLK
ncbi:MAG: lamin tail domain-containing protein [Candidatus Krumholzibacteriota bacterium]